MDCWLEDVEVVLGATHMSPIYINAVREEWIKAAQQKQTFQNIPEDPENLPKQPNKPTGPKPARKHVAKKSGAGHRRAGDKDKNKEDVSQQDPIAPLQTEDLGGQPEDVLEEPGDDTLPPGPGMDPKDPLTPKPKPKKTQELNQKVQSQRMQQVQHQKGEN